MNSRSDKREKLSKLLARLEDLDNNAWNDPGSKVPKSVVRANLEAKVKVLRDQGVEPSATGSLGVLFNEQRRAG